MLGNLFRPPLTELDVEAFKAYVPADHFLRKALRVIPWESFEGNLEIYYCPDQGRPPELPVLMLKLEYLRYQYQLSDRQVILRAQTDIAFRYFLQVARHHPLPAPSSLCRFRGRLGEKGFREIFDRVVGIARQNGLVKDRLRIKDATHVIADIHIPTTLALIAQTRDKLLVAAEPFEPLLVEGERINLGLLRESTRGHNDQTRLASRVANLQDILAWVDELPPPEDAETNGPWQKLRRQCALAHKILGDQEPNAGDKTRSTVDPDARRSRHGAFFDGYMLDILVDADSSIITQINVLPGNGDEAADAPELVRREEAAHGNDIEALSIDGIGYNGPVLRELEDPDGLAIDTTVPPKAKPDNEIFGPEKFVDDPATGGVVCPAGKVSCSQGRDRTGRATIHRFAHADCATCPLRSNCMKKPSKPSGRKVYKNDYEVEYRRVHEKAATEAYAQVRAEHPQVERKLGEIMNCHSGRRARYRGSGKVFIQQLMACTATNVKRIVKLVCAPEVALTCEH
jgi:IS5 family transposase